MGDVVCDGAADLKSRSEGPEFIFIGGRQADDNGFPSFEVVVLVADGHVNIDPRGSLEGVLPPSDDLGGVAVQTYRRAVA